MLHSSCEHFNLNWIVFLRLSLGFLPADTNVHCADMQIRLMARLNYTSDGEGWESQTHLDDKLWLAMTIEKGNLAHTRWNWKPFVCFCSRKAVLHHLGLGKIIAFVETRWLITNANHLDGERIRVTVPQVIYHFWRAFLPFEILKLISCVERGLSMTRAFASFSSLLTLTYFLKKGKTDPITSSKRAYISRKTHT